jgi:hypothetical protein
MKTPPLKDAVLTEGGVDSAKETREAAPERAAELLAVDGPTPSTEENAPLQSLCTLIAQQPFFKGLTLHQLQLLARSAKWRSNRK